MRYALLVVLAVGFAACSKFSKLQKSENLDLKKEGAYAYYDKRDFYRASQLLEELVPLLKGTQDAEKSEFLFAMCQYELRFLESASFYFNYFLESYPRSIYAEEALYMEALSQYENSPSYYLDQGNTDKAILALETYIQKYPDSERRVKCQTMIDRLNEKLEKKDFENAKLFHQVMEYKAAIIALGNFAKNYPSSSFREEALYLQVLSAYKLARNSTEAKKLERYQQTIEFYTTFANLFPKSKRIKELESVFDASSDMVAGLKKSVK